MASAAKYLALAVKELQAEKKKFTKARDDLNASIASIDDQLARITGTGSKSAPAKANAKSKSSPASGKRRKRKSNEEKMAIAQKVFEKFKANKGTRFRPSEIENTTDGLKMRDLFALTKKTSFAFKREGDKATAVYGIW